MERREEYRAGVVRVEACVDSVESALAAQAGGASRVELCDDLVEGGTTPSAGMIATCRERLRIPLFVIIRPRGGDFHYSEVELEVMRRDIATARELGADGVVLGVLHRDGSIDEERTRALVEEAGPLSVTFHRAFDVCREPFEALEVLVRLGIDRVLTSGQAATAEQGIPVIAGLVRQAAGRIGILAGGGIREGNVQRIVRETGVREVHLRGTRIEPSAMQHRNPAVAFGGRAAISDELREVTDPARIRRILELTDDPLAGADAPERW